MAKKSGFRTKDEAATALEQKNKESMLKKEIEHNSVLVNRYVDEWFKNNVETYTDEFAAGRQHLSMSTVMYYKTRCDAIKEFFVNTYICELSKEHIRAFYLFCLKTKKNSATTIQHNAKVLNRILNSATIDGYLETNPCNVVSKPKRMKFVPHFFTIEEMPEVKDLFENTSIELIVWICLFMGLRAGEACAVKYDDIDFQNKTLTVRHQIKQSNPMSRRKRTDFQDSPYLKSTRGYRTLKIPEFIFQRILKNYRQHEMRSDSTFNSDNYIVCTKHGDFMIPPYIYSKFTKKLSKVKKFGKHRVHDMRGTFATTSLERGVPITTVASAIGDEVTTVMKHYVKAVNNTDACTDVMDQIVGVKNV